MNSLHAAEQTIWQVPNGASRILRHTPTDRHLPSPPSTSPALRRLYYSGQVDAYMASQPQPLLGPQRYEQVLAKDAVSLTACIWFNVDCICQTICIWSNMLPILRSQSSSKYKGLQFGHVSHRLSQYGVCFKCNARRGLSILWMIRQQFRCSRSGEGKSFRTI